MRRSFSSYSTIGTMLSAGCLLWFTMAPLAEVRVVVEQTGSGTTVSWPAQPPGFTLETASNLGFSVTWVPTNVSVSVQDGFNRAVIPSSAGAFFRVACPAVLPDLPDASFLDTNCDGIDGDLTNSIFVAALSGADDPDCGLLPTDPCRTITQALQRAVSTGRRDVLIQSGSYSDGPVVLRNGKNLFGGYDTSWVRAGYQIPGHDVYVYGGLYPNDQEMITLVAHSLSATVTVANLVLYGADAQSPGKGSQVIHAFQSSLLLEDLQINAGNGADGASGTNGQDAATVSATVSMNGNSGGPAGNPGGCDSSSRGSGGTAGANGAAVLAGGGAGGNGGLMDTSCGLPPNGAATAGNTGSAAQQFSSNVYGAAGGGGLTCGPGQSGLSGRVVNGAPGGGGNSSSMLTGYWRADSGGSGGTGLDGTGGGGGGGSGGCDTSTEGYGAGGGGGGAGGAAALSGGSGGQGGGGSFGILAYQSNIRVTRTTFNRGIAGDGGDGGTGGRGQSGGAGGSGGLGAGSVAAGGAGGNGGHGGHGGGGGGGAGGISAGIFHYDSSITTVSCSYLGGTAGLGGNGGASAPGAPFGDQDGLDGNQGGGSFVQSIGECFTPEDCEDD